MIQEYSLVGFSIDNFRVFGKETNFPLAPITIVTGTNSSGKSSFTKALNLLHLSYKKNGLSVLSLMENKLKMGGFDSMINLFEKRSEISFGLDIDTKSTFEKKLSKYKILLVYNNKMLKKIKVFDDSSLLLEREFDLTTWGKLIVIKSFIKLPEAIINRNALHKLFKGLPESDFNLIFNAILNYLQNDIEAHTFKDDFVDDSFDTADKDVLSEHYHRILEGLKNVGEIHSQNRIHFDPESLAEITYQDDHVYSVIPMLKEILPLSILEITDKLIQEEYLHKYLELGLLHNLDLFPDDLLKNIFNRLIFIDGVRATQEIVYTNENSPGFYEILEKFNNSSNPDLMFIEKWVVEKFRLLKLPDGKKFTDIFKIIQIPGYGYMLQIWKDDQNIGIAGLGYGVTQLLPILLKVSFNLQSIFVIEEPESNLHPALQSKLADFFAEAIKPLNDFFQPRQFIIETHSEYLIRKLQYLTANGEVATDQTQLYYFNIPEDLAKSEEQIKNININEDGSLTDGFGTGFFDEADNIALELFLLNQSQKN